MTTKTYNNWTNYETWCVNLWLTNEEGTSQEPGSLLSLMVSQNPKVTS